VKLKPLADEKESSGEKPGIGAGETSRTVKSVMEEFGEETIRGRLTTSCQEDNI
jgi:hypothetical protein